MNQIVDTATEDVVIGSLILNPNEYNAISKYFPEVKVFSQKKAQNLWIKVSKMIRSGAHVDTVTVCSSITNNDISRGVSKGYVVDCTSNACSLGMTETYAQKVYEKYLLRKIVQEADNIKNDVANHGYDVYELISN